MLAGKARHLSQSWSTQKRVNGTAHFKNVNNSLNANFYSYLETSGGESSNLYLNVVYVSNTSIN